ncbi:MAG TPA: helix-turn-helix domain-containing protein [Dehalococcoidia bacterium]|nr:helix-turn-helix domain-containing protein [Dehalococcoidia bacterium]
MDLEQPCPKYKQAISILGKRWTGLIIRALLGGSCHFSSITSYVQGLSDRLLSQRLKELEAEGIVERHIYPETPVRVEYVLTPKGKELQEIVEAIQRWADRWTLDLEEGEEPEGGRARRGP